jgi:hypothetical protein
VTSDNDRAAVNDRGTADDGGEKGRRRIFIRGSGKAKAVASGKRRQPSWDREVTTPPPVAPPPGATSSRPRTVAELVALKERERAEARERDAEALRAAEAVQEQPDLG